MIVKFFGDAEDQFSAHPRSWIASLRLAAFEKTGVTDLDRTHKLVNKVEEQCAIPCWPLISQVIQHYIMLYGYYLLSAFCFSQYDRTFKVDIEPRRCVEPRKSHIIVIHQIVCVSTPIPLYFCLSVSRMSVAKDIAFWLSNVLAKLLHAPSALLSHEAFSPEVPQEPAFRESCDWSYFTVAYNSAPLKYKKDRTFFNDKPYDPSQALMPVLGFTEQLALLFYPLGKE